MAIYRSHNDIVSTFKFPFFLRSREVITICNISFYIHIYVYVCIICVILKTYIHLRTYVPPPGLKGKPVCIEAGGGWGTDPLPWG